MKILLINNNPVVSRLTALSARKEDIEIDEIQEVTELSSGTYDIVFVDADSWSKDVRDVISENIKTQKSVLFYGDGDEEEKGYFDLSILKPFLPSEVSAVIRSIEENSALSASPSSEENHFNILDDTKTESRDDLFDLNELEEKKEEVKVEVQESNDLSFDDKLGEAFPLKINTLDDDLFEDEVKLDLDLKDKKPDTKNKDNDLFDLDLDDEVPSLDDDFFIEKSKEKTLLVNDELKIEEKSIEIPTELKEESSLISLEEEFSLEIEEPVLEEIKKETKVLDQSEIENIKGILTEDVDSDMTLEDLMPAMSMSAFKEEVKEEESLDVDSSVLVQSFSAMPVESLRELLAGATVNIKIKFPKSKK